MKRAATVVICGAWIVGALVAVGGVTAIAAPGVPTPSEDIVDLVTRLGLVEEQTPVRERAGWRPPRTIVVRPAGPGLVEALRQVAPGVKFVEAGTAEAAAMLAAKADAVLGFCAADLLAAGPNVRWIQSYSAGVEQCVAIPALRERDILLTNMQRVAGPVMAEHVLAMMFAFARGLDFYIPEHSARRWTPTSRMVTLDGKTVLVVGLGGIGTEVAKRAHALGMKVDAVRASGREGPEYVREVGLPADLLRLAATADFIVNTTPLTPATRQLYDAKFFAAAKPGAYFFNVGRGQSVVQSALVDALRSGRLAGAGLDVTDPEPLPADDVMWSLPNVILTPHVSARSDLGDALRVAILRENVRRYVQGERMLSVVDTRRGY
ncbi:MAG TPA: D-2-hydroxyacid dehydrogenase [Steroidobacteraceae bacterium]|nr:D-2-hydroxyacid dehydrogenase [Steroidobacteraceae bacterium]